MVTSITHVPESGRSIFFNKKVFVAFPPNRHNHSVKSIANGSMVLGRGTLSKSQFAASITLNNGHILNKPAQW